MTRLQIFVALESVVLLVLGVMWWSRVDVAPSESGSPSPASLAHSPAAETSAPLRSDDAAQVDRRELEPVTSAPALDPVLSICVAGTVRNERGEAIAGAWVGFENDERTESGRSTTSGAYVVSGLTRGAWDVSASAEGYAPIEERRELDDRAWQSVDLVLRPWIALPVRFVDREGRALAPESLVGHMDELQLLATEQPLAADLRPAEDQRISGLSLGSWLRTSNAARKKSKELAAAGIAGELRLYREPPVVATLLYRHLRIAEQRVEPGQHELAFALDPADLAAKQGRVRLRLLDVATSVPLAGVTIRTSGGPRSSATTDETGHALLQDVHPGIVLLDAFLPEHEMLRMHVRVSAGDEIDLGELRLSRQVQLKGRVLHADGSPARGASITWTAVEARSWPAPLDTRITTSSDRDGRFTILAGRRRYVVFARSAEGARAFGLADNADPSFQEIVLRLAITSRVRLSYDDRASRGSLLVVESAEGLPAAEVTLDGARWNRRVDLPSGRYVAKVFDMADVLVSSRPFEVAGSSLELTLP
ncbi:MAG: carboxypeptidase regulatory-like domain-containing protein [Planctomycetes bacterium]|nr:carboxypeptidase regulatory-like domain-containing protein [Planctomycetota bacterium]